MGLKAPTLKGEQIEKELLTRGYGILGTTARIDEAATSFENSLNMVLKLAESEEALKRLIDEIQSTQRRVNALEFSIIPKQEEIIRMISFKLSEMEREDFFRLKLLKGKKEK